jgi:MYXO-CTERM domain-containing protein
LFLSLVLALAAAACEAPPDDAAIETLARPLSIKKSYARKIYVHMMPWFQVGGLHWSLNSRNAATGIASWYTPLIGEYSSNDPVVIEYQLLTMKYAGIDGVLVDWPGLNGANDLPANKAAAEAIMNRTADFGLEFGIVYEDQDAVSVDAAKNDMSYARDNYFGKSNYIKVNGQPVLLVFGPQKIMNPNDWTNVLSVFAAKPTLFALWYNANAGSNAQGQFAWIAQNGLKGVGDFDNGLDGGNHGLMIPVLYPGFNPYYAAGGWPGPTWKISYTLKPDDTEGGDTFASTFSLGMYAGDPLQIATWNDYGEGTMVEPTKEFQYRFLTTLQQEVGATYTDAELKIVKQLFDQRRQFGGSKQAQLDQASTALANLDVATACGVLGCTVPVHAGSGGAGGSSTSGTGGVAGSGAGAAGASTGAAGAKGTAGTTGAAGAGSGAAGTTGPSTGAGGHAGAPGTAGHGGTTGAAGQVTGGGGSAGKAGTGGGKPAAKSSGCSVAGSGEGEGWTALLALIALTLTRRRAFGAASIESERSSGRSRV